MSPSSTASGLDLRGRIIQGICVLSRHWHRVCNDSVVFPPTDTSHDATRSLQNERKWFPFFLLLFWFFRESVGYSWLNSVVNGCLIKDKSDTKAIDYYQVFAASIKVRQSYRWRKFKIIRSTLTQWDWLRIQYGRKYNWMLNVGFSISLAKSATIIIITWY